MQEAWLRSLNLVFVFILPLAGAVGAVACLALGRVTAVHVALFLFGFVTTGLGITVGYHRLATHRSFEVHPALKVLLLVFGSIAVQGPLIWWVAYHTKHHADADGSGDPHSPRHGFWHSHWGWLFGNAGVAVEQYAPVLMRDRTARVISGTFLIWVAAGYVIPFLVAGWDGLIWGGLFRQLAVQNVTFAVNSVCHRFGSQPFKTGDLSTNNWIVGVLGLGEGWHNNHHAFPTSALHGLRWWEVDLSGRFITWLEALGLAWNVKRPALLQIQRMLAQPAMLPAYAPVAAVRSPRGDAA